MTVLYYHSGIDDNDDCVLMSYIGLQEPEILQGPYGSPVYADVPQWCYENEMYSVQTSGDFLSESFSTFSGEDCWSDHLDVGVWLMQNDIFLIISRLREREENV
jgi:hypothetical protein